MTSVSDRRRFCSVCRRSIDSPFRWIPHFDRNSTLPVSLLNLSSGSPSYEFRVCDSCVFVHLTEYVLAVHQLKRPSPERSENNSSRVELFVLSVCNQANHVCWIVVS